MISIIIPTLNEEDNILKTIFRIKKLFLKIKKNYEIIIVDEKSIDKTVTKVRNLQDKKIKLIASKKKLGLGYAIYQGIQKSNGEYILLLDADNSVNNIHLEKIIKSIQHNKLIIGSRYTKKSKIIGVSKLKIFLSKYINKIISFLFHLKVNDSSHSLRVFHKKFKYRITNFNHPIFFWENTIKAKALGYNICEIPIQFNERISGKTKNSFNKLFKNILFATYSVYKLKMRQANEKK